MRPSIISEGATMSAPTLAILQAIPAKIAVLMGMSISPLASKTPQCPENSVKLAASSHMKKSSFKYL